MMRDNPQGEFPLDTVTSSAPVEEVLVEIAVTKPLWPKPTRRISSPSFHVEEKKEDPPASPWTIPLNHVQVLDKKAASSSAEEDPILTSPWKLPSRKIGFPAKSLSYNKLHEDQDDSITANSSSGSSVAEKVPSEERTTTTTTTTIPIPKIKLVEKSPFFQISESRRSLEMEKNQAELEKLRELNKVAVVASYTAAKEGGPALDSQPNKDSSSTLPSKDSSSPCPPPKRRSVQQALFESSSSSTTSILTAEMTKNQAELEKLRQMKIAYNTAKNKKEEPLIIVEEQELANEEIGKVSSSTTTTPFPPPRVKLVEQSPLQSNISLTTPEMTKYQTELEQLRERRMTHAIKDESLSIDNNNTATATTPTPITVATPPPRVVVPKPKITERIPLQSSSSFRTPEMTKYQAELEMLREMQVTHVITTKQEHPTGKANLVEDGDPPVMESSNRASASTERSKNHLPTEDEMKTLTHPTKVRLRDHAPLESNISLTTAEMSKNQAELEELRARKAAITAPMVEVSQEQQIQPVKPEDENNDSVPSFSSPPRPKVKLVHHVPLQSNATLVTSEMTKQQEELDRLREMKATRIAMENKSTPPPLPSGQSKPQPETYNAFTSPPPKSKIIDKAPFEVSRRSSSTTAEMEKNQAELAKLRALKTTHTTAPMEQPSSTQEVEEKEEGQALLSSPPPKRKLLQQAPLTSNATSTTAEMVKQQAELEALRKMKVMQATTTTTTMTTTVKESPSTRNSLEPAPKEESSFSSTSKAKPIQSPTFVPKRRVSTMEMERTQAELQQLRARMQTNKDHSETSPSSSLLPTLEQPGGARNIETQQHITPEAAAAAATAAVEPDDSNIRKVRLVQDSPFATKRRVSTIEMEKTQAELKQLRELMYTSTKDEEVPKSMSSSVSSLAIESSETFRDEPVEEPQNNAYRVKLVQDPPFATAHRRVSTMEMERNQLELMQLRELMQNSEGKKEDGPLAASSLVAEEEKEEHLDQEGVPKNTPPRVKLIQTSPFATKSRISTMEMERNQAELQQLREMSWQFEETSKE